MIQRFEAPGWGLGADIPVQLWSPEGLDAEQPARLVVVHDGSAYSRQHMGTDDYSGPDVLGKVDDLIRSGEIPPMRVMLLDPVDRHRWYTALSEYNNVLALSVMHAVHERVATIRPKIAIGASLGALSLLACSYEHPEAFDGLLLQSTSFHHPDYDSGENRTLNDYYAQGAAFIENLRSAPCTRRPLQVSITCGWEGNLGGNKALDEILDSQGHQVKSYLVDGGHDLYSWGRALTPHLGSLIKRCLSVAAENN